MTKFQFEEVISGMNKVTTRGYAFQLRCSMGHEFMLLVERHEDLDESNILDGKKQAGLVIFRDRSFVECGYCKSYCRFTGVEAVVEVDYTPPTIQ